MSGSAYPLPARLVADLIGMSEDALAKTAVVIDMMVDTTVTPEQAGSSLAAGGRDGGAHRVQAGRAG